MNISAATLLTKLATSKNSSSTSASWNAFEKIRFAAVRGKLPSGGCPEDVTLTVPLSSRRTRPPDIVGCPSHKRTLARGPIRLISDALVTPTPCCTKVAGRLSRLIANLALGGVVLLKKEEFPPMNKYALVLVFIMIGTVVRERGLILEPEKSSVVRTHIICVLWGIPALV